MIQHFVSCGITHKGRVRERNEDAFIERSDIGLWAVADGAGGHGSGDVASAAVVAALADLPSGLSAAELLAQVRLRLSAVHADLQHRRLPNGPTQIMASTAVVLMARKDHFACLWAGDSRAYLFRAGRLIPLTKDHSLVQDLVDSGLVEAAAASAHPRSNVITRAVGADGPLELDKNSAELAQGDMFLLCSDGLHGALQDTAIARMLSAGADAESLIEAALDAGSRDNVTAVLIRAPGPAE